MQLKGKHMLMIISLLFFLAVTPLTTLANEVFSDVEGALKDEIIAAYELHFVNGFPDGTYRPQAEVTTGQFSIILSRVFQESGMSVELEEGDATPITREQAAHYMNLGLQLEPANESFRDVPDESEYAGDIGAIADTGLITGYSAERFGYGDTLTRAQAAALAVRLYEYIAPAEELDFTADNELPNVAILATGGTIAGSAPSNTATTGYQAGAIAIETLIEAVPEMEEIANISGEQIVSVGSPNITNDTLLTLGKRINELLATDEVDGIVVTHGTDTLEETAYFLNLVVKSEKPVVVVGAMRPATAISADGPMNLYNAVLVAGDEEAKGRGVLVTFNDRIGAAREVTKTNTTALDTFRSTEQGYLGRIVGGKPYFYNETTRKHTTETVFDISNLSTLPQVDIIYGYQNDNRYMYDAAVENGAKGIVVAGSGNGSMSSISAEGAQAATEKGVHVVRSTRVGNGTVSERSALTADSLNPQKARILLMLALTETDDPAEIQRYFNEY
ncbi:L-asparaginase type II [Halalkalibacter oceani]